ncbi:MAG: hypothetical protein P9M05_00005 [Candidatus Stygibacter australis]|nr:hypothetical protein [Candidatus Stygibacter australis]
MNKLKKNSKLFLFIVVLVFISSCAVSTTTTTTQNKTNGKGNDTVLRNMCLGTEALYYNDHQKAKRLFEDVTTSISGIWGDSPEARKARSLWYEEAIKPFKGEPYERMMAFYYMGIIYLQNNDFGNAQAAFRQSVMQDAFAEEEQNRADVALPLFLQGWALQSQGSKRAAKDAYDLLNKIRPDFETPSLDKQPNVVLIVETGKSPRKVPDGVGSYQLKFFRGKFFDDKAVKYSIDNGSTKKLYPMEDIYWQASSRGGRAVDRIVNGKVQFKETTGDIGTALTDISSELLDNPHSYGSGAEEVGLALGVVGVASILLSASTHSAVDSRYWDNLPDAIHITTLDLAPGNHKLNLTFYNEQGFAIPELSRILDINVKDKNNIFWFSAWDRDSKKY